MGYKTRILRPPKNCVWCEKLFKRRTDERTSVFKARRTCSIKCGSALAISVRTNLVETPSEKVCEWCERPFTRRGNQRAEDFRRKKTCGTVCTNLLIRKNLTKTSPTPTKVCEFCEKSFDRRDDEGRSHFSERKSCSKKCGRHLTAKRQMRIIDVSGVYLTMVEIAKDAGVSRATIQRRHATGRDLYSGKRR